MRRIAPVALALVALIGCKPTNQASPDSISNGVTNISKNMAGLWKAAGGPSCRWWISTARSGRGGKITNPGNTEGPNRTQRKSKAADRSQTVIIGTGNAGQYFHSDNCGKAGWTQ